VGVKEIRVKDEQGIFRVIYVVKYLDRIIVLHAFQKKTQKTAKKDLDLAKQRLKLVLEDVKNGK
jgi:phage-related protein